MSRPLRLVGAAAAAASAVWITFPMSPASAAIRYSATASATGLRILTSSPTFPVATTPVDVTFPSAQAQISTLQGNAAYAGYPNPGSDAAALPGTVAGVLGGLSPVPLPILPGLPTVESAQCPVNPSAGVDAKAFVLKADCDRTSATAVASSGVQPASVNDAAPSGSAGYLAASASTKVEVNTGKVMATSRSEVSALSIGGGMLTVGPIITTATVVRFPGGDPQRSTDLALGRIAVAGRVVQMGPSGITVDGRPVLPGVPSLADALNAILKGTGITVTQLKATNSPDGVVAPGLAIDVKASEPAPVITRFVLGQVLATVTVRDQVQGTVNSSVATGSLPSGSPTIPSTPADVVWPAVPTVGDPAVPPTVGDAGGSTGTVPSIPTTEAGVPSLPPTQVHLAGRDADLKGLSFYPILVFAALVVISGVTLTRYVGVRLLWSS